ncbi:hypothetical protein [Stenotrophomonas sp.]|uniref:hypothetical protein n=1 Tax=Stenotrophomonas sp. TaxID=69392 RepID=UPI0028AB9FEA|nr:hypothetical protein [Stenotrophomonas sp.]
MAAFGSTVAALSTIAIAALARKEVMRREEQARKELQLREAAATKEVRRREAQARNDASRREAESKAINDRLAADALRLAVAIAYSPISADLALAARVTGAIPLGFKYDLTTVNRIIDAAKSFVTPGEIVNLADIMGLENEVLKSVLVARGQMKLIHKTAVGLSVQIESAIAKTGGVSTYLSGLDVEDLEVEYIVGAIEHMAAGLIAAATALHGEAGALSDMPWIDWSAKRDYGAILKAMNKKYGSG